VDALSSAVTIDAASVPGQLSIVTTDDVIMGGVGTLPSLMKMPPLPLPPPLLGPQAKPDEHPLLAPPPSSSLAPDDEPPVLPSPPLDGVPHALATATTRAASNPKLKVVCRRERRILSYLGGGAAFCRLPHY
jgi:hypothetical protein